MPETKSPPTGNRALWVLLALLVVSSFGASLVQTSFGDIEPEGILGGGFDGRGGTADHASRPW